MHFSKVKFELTVLSGSEFYVMTYLAIHTVNLENLLLIGITHLVHTQNFPENQHFLHPDTHT